MNWLSLTARHRASVLRPGAVLAGFLVVAGTFEGLSAAPNGPWRTATPESQGFSASRLEGLRADLASRKTRAFLVIRKDAMVCEWYAPGQDADTKFGTASLAKALVGGLSLAVAMTDGRLALDDPAAKFIPQWRDDARKSRITVRQLGSHTSGVEDAEADGKPHDQLTGWKGDFWKRLAVPNDPFTLARDRAPLLFAPGERMRYSNPGIALMTWCVTASLSNAPQKDIRSLLRERVMRPIGVPDSGWSAGYGQTFLVDGLPLVPSWGGGSYTARATARVGRLMLRGGDWDGRPLLSADAVRLTTSDAATPGPCGMGWWSNQEGDCAELPRDAFFGSGAGHQILLVVPSLNMVVVRFGGELANVATDPKSFHEAYNRFLFAPLIAAITNSTRENLPPQGQGTSAAPYPPSQAIERLKWAPKNTIIRKARGSDNWPMTSGFTMHLVFSGDDSFSVRRASLVSSAGARTGRAAEQGAALHPNDGWRSLPLITDGKVDTNWTHVGWGGFVVDGDDLRTECHPKGLGLLYYAKEKLGNCQIRVVFKSKDAKSNAGVFVRIPDGIKEQIGRPGAAFDRSGDGKISPSSMKAMMESAEREEGPWFAVHRGYEIQIMDDNDKWHRTGAIYSLAAASAVSQKTLGEWKTMIITLAGNRIFVDVDGQRVTSFDPARSDVPGERKWFEPKRAPERPKMGYLGLQNHDPGDVVWFREISVRPLPDGNTN